MFITCTSCLLSFFFNDTATTEIYTLSLHDALPIYTFATTSSPFCVISNRALPPNIRSSLLRVRSEEHTSELQSQSNLVCRLLLEKKNCNQSPARARRCAPLGSHCRHPWFPSRLHLT